MDSPQNNVRLDRIEEKIDRMADAMISIARAEEKILAIEQKHSAQYDRINKLSEKMALTSQAINLTPFGNSDFFSDDRPIATTSAPAISRILTVAKPIPDVPPNTIAFLFIKSI